MAVHLVFFPHITTGPDNTNNVLALAFGVVIVTRGRRRLALDYGQPERRHDVTRAYDDLGDATLML